MSDQAWIGLLGIIVGVLTVAVGTLTAFLFRQAISTNTLECDVRRLREEREQDRERIDRYEKGMRELGELLGSLRRSKKSRTMNPYDSDEPG